MSGSKVLPETVANDADRVIVIEYRIEEIKARVPPL
jgi:hypothetical protein